MFYVYIVECKDGSFYTGNTANLETLKREAEIKGWSRIKKENLTNGL